MTSLTKKLPANVRGLFARAVGQTALADPQRLMLALCGLFLLVLILIPKLAAVAFANVYLWLNLDAWLWLIAQDLALWAAVMAPTAWVLMSGSRALTTIWWLSLGLLELVLLADMRVRELWLKPLDFAIVRYAITELPTIDSSSGLFLHGDAGFGIDMRVLVAGVGVSHIMNLPLFLYAQKPLKDSRRIMPAVQLGFAALTFAFCLGAAYVPPQSYALHENVLLRHVVKAMRPEPEKRSEVPFDQPIRPVREVFAAPRVRLQQVAPFENVVLVMLESFRFRALELGEKSRTPNLARLAREGMLAKAYVSVPHSSKGLYSALAGRAASAGVVIRESALQDQDSVFRTLKQRGASTFAFSTAYLPFENTDGLLHSQGIDVRFGPDGLKADSKLVRFSTSFGIDDGALVDAPLRILEQRRPQKFAIVYLTIDTHHPYLYPDKARWEDDRILHYERSIIYTDEIIDRVFDGLTAKGYGKNTLFVLVGDHGESFGEHGARVHNNSLYEEEITVPLVFWSEDGRLATPEVLEARQIDIAPTIADLMDLHDATFETQGVSLLRTERRPAAYVSSFFDGVSEALVLDGEKYLYLPTNDKLVRFDLLKDPLEREPIDVTGETRKNVLDRLTAARAYERSVWATD